MGRFNNLFSFHPRQELRELYLFTLFYSFAAALILVFEPIFFYNEGFSLTAIALYYAAHYALYFLLLPLGTMFAGKFGLERSLALSMPLFVVYFVALAALPRLPFLFYLAWVVLAIFKTFFWPAYNAEISKFSDKANRGTEISWFYAIQIGVGILGPAIGGFIIILFGFPVLFILTAGLSLFAATPLLRTNEKFSPGIIAYREPWQLITKRRDKTLRWGMAGWGSHFINTVYWPIFMFILLGAADKIGLLVSVNALIITMLGFFIGEMSDRFPRQKVIKLHLPFYVLGCLLRPLASSPTSVWLTDTLGKSAYIGVHIPMWYRLFHKAQSGSHIKYTTAIEMMVCVYKSATALALAAIFALSLPYTGFVFAFILSAILSLFFLFV